MLPMTRVVPASDQLKFDLDPRWIEFHELLNLRVYGSNFEIFHKSTNSLMSWPNPNSLSLSSNPRSPKVFSMIGAVVELEPTSTAEAAAAMLLTHTVTLIAEYNPY